MRILAYILLCFLITAPAWADEGVHDALLNKVKLKLTAEQYVTTKSALVTIGINASVNGSGLDKIQDDILKQLIGISVGEWHIVSFDRSQDQSGLEKVQISAQARLPTAALANLRDKAKAISKPGETFTLDNVEFVPSEDELRDANAILRNNIYAQTKDELDRLVKMYPDQKYFVHDVDFINDYIRVPMPMNAMAVKLGPNTNSSSNLAVGDKLVVTATVTLASLPDHGLLKPIT